MAIIRGDNSSNTISATGPNDTIFGLSGFDVLSSTFERADLRGGWGQDILSVDYAYTISWPVLAPNSYALVGPLPLMRWSLSGDQGDDSLSVSVLMDTDPAIGMFDSATVYPVADIILDGGSGNDTLSVDAAFVLMGWGSGQVGTETPEISAAVIDLEGNNTVNISMHNEMMDATPHLNTTVILGDGNDTVTVDNYTEADNSNGHSTHDIDLGNGTNSLTVNDRTGNIDLNILAGSGNDNVALTYTLDGGNSWGTSVQGHIDLGAGDDTLALTLVDLVTDFADVDVTIDLGAGNNIANISGGYFDHYDIVGGVGDDFISIDLNTLFSFDYGAPVNGYSVAINAGDGNNSISVALAPIYPFLNLSGASILTGTGSDTIVISGGLLNVIDSGAGNDTISAGSGTDTITLGAGSDTLNIDRAIFNLLTGPTERLTVNDFTLADGDSVALSGWNIPALGGTGILDDAADLQALKTPGGDVLGFVQLGADALLSLDLGGGAIAEILFKNLDISAPPPPPPPTDPKLNLSGTYGNDTLTGGNNDDIIFLRRGRDVATGNEGADVFRFNAVNSHNTNGDHHVITDLDFLEGDELRFQNFGPSWANNATDPANHLEYQAGTFNNWIADSVADLRELRDSGAIGATLLAGGLGTEIIFNDQGGDLVRMDLWGVFV
ncbi:hypothetical protein [Albidovulum sp.]|uniref:hypothetical protein n=1 Tax=Albidovulum sp. TaxID=1872424 RepID=UPI0039B87991